MTVLILTGMGSKFDKSNIKLGKMQKDPEFAKIVNQVKSVTAFSLQTKVLLITFDFHV